MSRMHARGDKARRAAKTLAAALFLAAAPFAAEAQTTAPAGGPAGAQAFRTLASEYRRGAEALRTTASFEPGNAGNRPMTSAESADAGAAEPAAPYDLPELLVLMRRGDPAGAAAAAQVRAAQGDLAGAWGAVIPSLSGSANGAWLGNPQDAIAIPAGALGMNPEIVLMPAVDPTQYSFSLVGEQAIFTWGKIRAGIRSAEAGLEAARLAQAKALHESTVRLQASYDALCYITMGEATLRLQRTAGDRLLTLAELNYRNGFMTATDLLGVRITVKEIDIGLATLAERRERLLSELGVMIGQSGLSLDMLVLAPPALGGPALGEAETATLVGKGSYDLALARALVNLKRELAELARARAWALPDLGLRVELSYSGSKFPLLEEGWRDADDYQLIIGLGASGKLSGDAVQRGALERARAELDQALAQVDEAERRLRSFVRESYLSLDLYRTRIEYALLKQESWAASLAQLEAELSAGSGSETAYLSLLVEALGGMAEAYGTMAEYRSALHALEAAAGSLAP